jgi:Outer membrane protein beta-barrel domain
VSSLAIWRASAIAAALIVCVAAVAGAQPYAGSGGPHARSVEVGGGVMWNGGYDAGNANATLTRNPTTGTAPLTLFETEGQMLSAPGAGVQIGVYFGRRISAEGTFQYTRPILRSQITRDFESADSVDADETITSYLVGGSVLYHFGEGRLVPFVAGGAGYLRQLHDGSTEVLTGTEFHAGGGVKYWLGSGSHRFGLRVDTQMSARAKSIAFEQKRRIVPSLAAGISYLF